MEDLGLRQKYWVYASNKLWKCNVCGKKTHRLGPHMEKHAQTHETESPIPDNSNQTNETKIQEDPQEYSEKDLVEKILKMKRISHYTFPMIAKKLGIPISKVIEINKQLKGGCPKTLQFDIVQRFLKGTELENFWTNYKANAKTVGGRKRGDILKLPITKEDLALLKAYAVDVHIPIQELSKEKNIPIGQLYSRISRIATKVIAQYPQIIEEALTNAT